MNRIEVDWTRCDGHGSCAELLPELVGVDEWGYPLLSSSEVPEPAQRRALRAARACPLSALRVTG
jgi:ferredoxin